MNGFVNLGNTCYLNATLQLIFTITEIKEYFTSKIFLKELNSNLKDSNLKDNNIKKNIIFIQNFFSLINDYSNNNNKIFFSKNL